VEHQLHFQTALPRLDLLLLVQRMVLEELPD
jgi:hypothetical protein